jgi:hypothetical protein
MSLQDDSGPWEGFAEEQIHDWLAALQAAQPGVTSQQRQARATHTLTVVRGLLLDLLATNDANRIARALREEAL